MADPGTGGAVFAGASADGSRVFFGTNQKLTADDTDTGLPDVYERAGGATRLVSQPSGVADPDTNGADFRYASADGSRVFFGTNQKLTADDTDTNRMDVYERAGGATTLVSQPTGVADPDTGGVDFRGASADGARVFFETAQKLTADDTDAAFRVDAYERAGGVTRLVSQPTGVADPDTDHAGFVGASADGSRVFVVTNQKLTADDMDSDATDVYERAGGVTTLVSQPTGVADTNTDGVDFVGASADGSRVFFLAGQKLTADDTDTNLIDVYERAGGATTLISQPTGVADPDTDHAFFRGASADGSRVFFETNQKLTADDTDSGNDLYERAGGVTTLVSQPTGVAAPATGGVDFVGASADGARVFFQTAQKLTADDTDSAFSDVYERAGGVTTLVSQPTGVADPDTNNASFAGVSADGSRIFFETLQKLTADDADSGFSDVYERAGGVTTLVSQPGGVADPDTGVADFAGASAGGSRVFFETLQKLTADDTDTNQFDVYAAGSPDPPPPAPPGPPPGGMPPPLPILLPGACANQKSGTAGPDLLDGTSAGDALRGLAGNDRLNGFAGRDCLFGGAGNDRLVGGTGNDRLAGNAGSDRAAGGAGSDRAAGGAGNDRLAGGAGGDNLGGGTGNDSLTGGPGNDRLSGGAGKDKITAGKGNNKISAGAGADVVNAANNKADRVACGKGRDKVRADNNDTLTRCERVRRV